MKNIIFIISIQTDERSKNQSHFYSCKSWMEWGKKNNAEVFLLNENVLNPPQWNKILIFDLLDSSGIEYDKILYVDADTIVHPDMPNIFEMHTTGDFCGVRNYGSMDWVIRSIENYGKFVFPDVYLSWTRYINTGMMLFDKTHRPFFNWLIEFNDKNWSKLRDVEKMGVGKDQPVINYGLQINHIKLNILPYEFNMQDMNRFEIIHNDMLFTKFGWIYHYNCGIKPTPAVWMERTYKYLYGE